MSEEFVPSAEFSDGVYKKWHKRGFINIGYWAAKDGKPVNKVTVEVGTISDKGLTSASKCFLSAYEFLAYLRAEINKVCSHVYPDFAAKGLVVYGGSTTKDGVESRVFSSVLSKDKDGNLDVGSRKFQCGKYKGRKNEQGAIMPIYAEKISEDSIKLSMKDLAEMFEVVNLKVITASLLTAALVEEG